MVRSRESRIPRRSKRRSGHRLRRERFHGRDADLRRHRRLCRERAILVCPASRQRGRRTFSCHCRPARTCPCIAKRAREQESCRRNGGETDGKNPAGACRTRRSGSLPCGVRPNLRLCRHRGRPRVRRQGTQDWQRHTARRLPLIQSTHSRGSTGSDSRASTANTHSCTRHSGSPRATRSNDSRPSAYSRCAIDRLWPRLRDSSRDRFSGSV